MVTLDDIEALACSESGCSKGFATVEYAELASWEHGVEISCRGCGSKSCSA